MATVLALGPVLGFLLVALLARPSAEADTTPAAVRRTIRRWRWTGLLLGVVVAAVAWDRDPLGRGVLLAAPLLALCVLAGVVVGETRAVRAAGSTRRAALETRRVRDYLPRVPGWTVVAAGGTLTALLAATTTAASADDLGRAGRSLAYDCGRYAGSHGPWAGSFYSLPLAAVVGVGVLLAGLALRRVVGRPRPQDAVGDLVPDDAERRRSAAAVTGAAGLLLTVPLIGVSLVTAAGLLASPCRPVWWTATAWLLILLVPGWLALLGWSGSALLTAGTRPTRPVPVPA
ncbi:hypothetical protein ACFO0M_05965 [Micromonospora mangrovi]|uniref:Integral membrane protein n=2 Tax=Micromonospora TaxID=1873 RepID=A0AAU7M2L7_9ACTN